MAELFRFSVLRPAERSKPSTLPLARPAPSTTSLVPGDPPKSFQDQLRDILQASVNPPKDAKSVWESLEDPSFDFIAAQAPSILSNSLWTKLAAFLDNIRQLLQNDATKIASDAVAKQFNDIKTQLGFADYGYSLSDLFLALMILRRGGPAHLADLIHTRGLWANTKLLADNPSLAELADWIRVAQVIKDGPGALIPPDTGSGNASAWHSGTAYKVGDFVSFKARIYRCTIAHVSQLGSSPDVLPSYWLEIPLSAIIEGIQAAFDTAMNRTVLFPPSLFSLLRKPVHSVGFRELHVVKQHIRRYQTMEISQIENILRGESRAHIQKHTLSNERDVTLQTTTTTETDKELTTTDRVDLKNESQAQVKEDTKLDAAVHASYDSGTFKLNTDLSAGYNKSVDDSNKFSSEVAKEVTQKAVNKVTQQITQTQTTKVIETFEDTQSQTFNNQDPGSVNISGVYQWVEKVYLSQVFNLGRHMLIDLMVPEPGANLLSAAKAARKKGPTPPEPLGTIKKDAAGNPIPDSDGNLQLDVPLRPTDLSTDKNNTNYYLNWVSKLQVTGVQVPPPSTAELPTSISQKGDGDIGQVFVNLTPPLKVPEGYRPTSVTVVVNFLHLVPGPLQGGANAHIDITVGALTFEFTQSNTDLKDKNQYSGRQEQAYPTAIDSDPRSGSDIAVTVTAAWVEQIGVSITVVCEGINAQTAWQIDTFDKIVAAWQKQQQDYLAALDAFNQELDAEGVQAEPLGGGSPDANRLIERTELKRQCIAIMDNSNATVAGLDGAVVDSLDHFPKDDTSPDKPVLPEPVLALSQTLGATVRWFEQAFEWENVAYVSYPYFWGRRSTWVDRLRLVNDDPLFVSFLQAGYARVVVPVRLGFECAVQVYLCTGLPWLGAGDVPPVGDTTQNSLYLDVAEEIKALTGGGSARETETPIGDPWEYTLPTTLIKLRKDDSLPEWHRVGADGVENGTDLPSNAPDGPWSWKDGAPKP